MNMLSTLIIGNALTTSGSINVSSFSEHEDKNNTKKTINIVSNDL